jgi:hypothetical protein
MAQQLSINMKKALSLLLIISLAILAGLYWYNPERQAKSAVKQLVEADAIQNGDIIFQTSLSSQSKAIQLATQSKYSHCGIIYREGGAYYVFEAIQPVKTTPLEQWIARGENGHFVIKRLKNAAQVLTPATLQQMKREGQKFQGKNYDLAFGWSDEAIYCSELVWKVYQRATGIELGKLDKLGNFDLSNKLVQQKMRERYGKHIPMDEMVISPAAVFDSEHLITVKEKL